MRVHTIDLQFAGVQHTIASYLLEGAIGLVLIETGPSSTLDTLLAGVETAGFRPKDVKHVFVTHIHLDHAGAAGWWAAQGAQVYVHPRGAKHLIDPSVLLASAEMVYGDAMESLWGEIRPIPVEQVTILQDGDVTEIGDISILSLDTQGHARHHHTYIVDDVAFTGDSVGSRMPGDSFVNLTSAPPQFDPIAFETTIDLLLTRDLSRLYLAHFGAVDDVAGQLETLREVVRESSGFVHGLVQIGMDDATIVENYVAWCRKRAVEAGVSAESLHEYDTANGFKMSGEGILLYWRKMLAK